MGDSFDVHANVRCECGHEFKVPLVGKNPETVEFDCPACGANDRFTPDQAKLLIAEYEAAKKTLGKAVGDAARNMFKGSGN